MDSSERMNMKYLTLFGLLLLAPALWGQTWRSTLYPEDWTPAYTDGEGRFLHDFSYAGYHSGASPVPFVRKNVTDVTQAPYYADNTGTEDVTAIVQRAADDLGRQGGGVLYFPAGEYRLSVPGRAGIRIRYDNTVLRGAGAGKTFLKNTTVEMRNKTVLLFEPDSGDWYRPAGEPVGLAADLPDRSFRVRVTDAASFRKGDRVVLTSDCSEAFIREHGCEGLWTPEAMKGVAFCRTVTGVDRKNGTVEIDVPTRYPLKTRDNARMYKIGPQLRECGLEALSIGNVQSPLDTWADGDFAKEGTGGYAVHGSHFVVFRNAENCWVRRIVSYRPAENDEDIHFLSNALQLADSRFITVDSCSLAKPRYEGGGGNGYLYTLEGNDCLLHCCEAEDGRHNFDFKRMSANGNVLYRCTGRNSRLASDFHMHLSMSNLLDGCVMDGDFLQAAYRPYGSRNAMHGFPTTQTVFWNTRGERPHRKNDYVIESAQYGWGYVIGTSGPICGVKTGPVSGVRKFPYDSSPEDFVEGVGRGETLSPASLYEDQLFRRIGRRTH